MQSFIILLTLCWPPLPQESTWPDLPVRSEQAVPAPIPDDAIIVDVTPEKPIAEVQIIGEIVSQGALGDDQVRPPDVESTSQPKPPRARVIIGYRKQCVNGVCRQVPIYAEPAPTPNPPLAPPPTKKEIADWERDGKVPPKPPPHSHRETGGKSCPWCGRTCWMVRLSEQAAARKGTTTQEEFQARYGSGTRYSCPRRRGPFWRWRR